MEDGSIFNPQNFSEDDNLEAEIHKLMNPNIDSQLNAMLSEDGLYFMLLEQKATSIIHENKLTSPEIDICTSVTAIGVAMDEQYEINDPERELVERIAVVKILIHKSKQRAN